MARDLTGLMTIDFEKDNKEIPNQNIIKFEKEKEDIVTLVDIDFLGY